MLSLNVEMEYSMKAVLGSSLAHKLLQLMFALPYIKISTMEKKKIAHRQTASVWLGKLSDAGILHPQKMGRTTYFINHLLLAILSS